LAGLCYEHCGSGAKGKLLSTALMGVDVDTLKLLLGTYANGDGGAYKGSLYLSTASIELSEQLRLVLARCGLIASVNELIHKPSKNSVVQKETIEYQVWVGTDTAPRLTTTRLPLSASQKQNSKRFFYEYENTVYLMTPIESIEEVPYDDNVYNFSVQEDESYVAEGLAVHNCKVPYDVCSICQHKSKTPKDYCDHARTMMNKILPDGRKVFVYNPQPKFFDISFVFIGADKTAKVMAKLASKGTQVCMGEFCVTPRLSADVGETFSKEAEWAGSEISTENQTGEFTSSSDNLSPLDPTHGRVTNSKRFGKEFIERLRIAKEEENKRQFPPAVLETNDEGNKQYLKAANEHYIHKCSCGAVISQRHSDSPNRKQIVTEKGCASCKTKEKTSGAIVQGDINSLERVFDQMHRAMNNGTPMPKKEAARVDRCKVCGKIAEVKVLWAEGRGYQPACEEHKEQVAVPFKRKDDFSGFKKYKNAPTEKEKTASDRCSCYGFGDDCGGTLEKFAEVIFPGAQKSASHRKVSELIKSIPAGPFTKKTLPRLEKNERDIPNEMLDRMGDMDLKDALSTPAMMGIILKPREFQRVMLVRIGEKSLADELDQKGEVFGPSSDIDESLEMSPTSNSLLKELLLALNLFRDRSAAHMLLSRRAVDVDKKHSVDSFDKEKTSSIRYEEEPLMRKLSAAYNGYRRSIIKKAADIEKYLAFDPQLNSTLFGDSTVQVFAGGIEKTSSTSVFSPNSLAYLTGAHYQDRELHITDDDVKDSLARLGALAEAIS
jgi:hypothetical protein